MIQQLNDHNLHGLDLFWLLVVCLMTGVALGILFFGSLWWTTKQMHRFQYPALWFITGFILRTSTVLISINWISDGRWQGLIACCVGFLVARVAVLSFTDRGQLSPQRGAKNKQELKAKPHGA
ncbi:ATP synthase subunit I [Rheinheimera sediminis]|uniref:ATP synthase subunit I n=1 Tax=Rheinheimera sp. YQF-1 TaxID=2499626 RepID=UPI000FDB1F46|nr:ATP synthase subunit I [Rheinheimera sp. YQF-1]RVT44897.1 ATP synthase subunit I [Rheinheimera sp. YQF-1]